MDESILDFLKNKDKNPKFLTDWSLWGENSSWDSQTIQTN